MTTLAPTPAPAPSPAPSPAPAPAPADWTSTLSEADRGLVAERQWKDPAALVDSYRNLERLRGVPADRLLTLPGDDKPESWNPVYDRLGRPKEAREYGLPVPDGVDGKFAETAAGWFHEAGLSKKQAQAVATKWNEFQATQRTDAETVYNTKIAADAAALKTKWGAAHDQNVGVAKQAAHGLGLSAEVIDHLERAMGFAGVMEWLHGLGGKMGQDQFVAPSTSPGFSGALAPAQAATRINDLMSDKAWAMRYLSGGVAEKAEMERLQKMRAGVPA